MLKSNRRNYLIWTSTLLIIMAILIVVIRTKEQGSYLEESSTYNSIDKKIEKYNNNRSIILNTSSKRLIREFKLPGKDKNESCSDIINLRSYLDRHSSYMSNFIIDQETELEGKINYYIPLDLDSKLTNNELIITDMTSSDVLHELHLKKPDKLGNLNYLGGEIFYPRFMYAPCRSDTLIRVFNEHLFLVFTEANSESPGESPLDFPRVYFDREIFEDISDLVINKIGITQEELHNRYKRKPLFYLHDYDDRYLVLKEIKSFNENIPLTYDGYYLKIFIDTNSLSIVKIVKEEIS